MQIDGEEEKVRLLGVDTPELKANGTKTTCGGDKAKALTSVLVLVIPTTITATPSAACSAPAKLKGRVDIGILLLITGNAAVYEKADFAAKPLYEKLQANAKRAKRGIWGECGGLLLNGAASPTATPKPSAAATPKALVTPTPTQTPRLTATPQPKATLLPEEEKPSYTDDQQSDDSSSGYSCGNSVSCSSVSNCAEAHYYLNSCGQKSFDRDGDGIPCESLCN